VVRRRWVTNKEFAQDLTLSQVLPGPNFSNIAVALGFRLGGWRGALWGGVALILPGALILLALAALYFRGGLSPTLGAAMHGMSAAVVGLVFATTARVIVGAIRDWRSPLLGAAVFLLVGRGRACSWWSSWGMAPTGSSAASSRWRRCSCPRPCSRR
jgi:chromate transporter